MKGNIIIVFLLLLTTARICAQTEERIYFYNNDVYISGTILEIVPDSTVTIKNDDGNIITYQMKYVRKIVKLQHEIVNKENPNQTEHRTFSITGGFYLTTRKNYSHLMIDPSFNYFFSANNSVGLILQMEEYSNVVSLHNPDIMVGASYQHYIGEKHNKPFIGFELFMNNEFYEVFEGGVCIGYNLGLSRNLAIQPIFKFSFYDFEEHIFKYRRVSLGIKVANFIF